MNNITNLVLLWKKPIFFSSNDKAAFYNWTKKIPCIDAIKEKNGSICLYIACKDLHDTDLFDLIGLFARYKINMKQLAVFLNKNNKEWFYDDTVVYWHKKVFE